MLEIRFLSQNQFKVAEARVILKDAGVSVVPISSKVEELQTEDSKRLVKDKAIKAFKQVGRPLFVEHTGLYINYMNGLPGGLTQIFWDNLQADKFCEIFGVDSKNTLEAKTVIGFIDGQQFFSLKARFEGLWLLKRVVIDRFSGIVCLFQMAIHRPSRKWAIRSTKSQ